MTMPIDWEARAKDAEAHIFKVVKERDAARIEADNAHAEIERLEVLLSKLVFSSGLPPDASGPPDTIRARPLAYPTAGSIGTLFRNLDVIAYDMRVWLYGDPPKPPEEKP